MPGDDLQRQESNQCDRATILFPKRKSQRSFMGGGLTERIRHSPAGSALGSCERLGVISLSYGNLCFLPIPSGRGQDVPPIEFKCFSQSCRGAFLQLLTRRFLAIHAENFFDPANPPIAILLDYSRI